MNNAEEGRNYWQRNKLDRYDCVLLIPDDGASMHTAILDTFQERIERLSDAGRQVRAVAAAVVPLPPSGSYETLKLTCEESEALLALYSLYEFTGNLIIGSFDLPYGRKLRNLLDSGVTTEESLISDVILGGLDETCK